MWPFPQRKSGAYFNPRPRAGGDPQQYFLLDVSKDFNPRPRAGGDLGLGKNDTIAEDFNPRPRAGGDLA